MKKLYIVFFILITSMYAHKLNIFTTFENNELIVNAYFANGSPCKNCKVSVSTLSGSNIDSSKTNEKGVYSLKISLKEFEVSIDAGGGHLTKEIIRSFEEELKDKKNKSRFINTELYNLRTENKELKTRVAILEEQLSLMEFFKIIIGLLVIVLIFMFLKKVKQ